jgi:fumarylacetoacetate (FAA) hydrolase
VGTGCFLEINGTKKLKDPDHIPQWLHEGDTIEMVIDELGLLHNTIVKENDYSILKNKKNVS